MADGTAFGFHVLGGLRFYLNRDFAIVAEGRYQWANDDMGDDFSPNAAGLVNTIDLSGATATLGVHIGSDARELRDAGPAVTTRGAAVSQGPLEGLPLIP